MNAQEWITRAGRAWANEWVLTDLSFAGLVPMLDRAILASMPATGRLVDIGCGAGTTSFAIAAARPGAEIVGLDLSPALVETARRRGGAIANCRFVEGDATATATVGALAPVDGFFSRHGVMFFDDPVAAFDAFATAVAPGARFVFSCFAALPDNPWAMQTAIAVGASPPPRGEGPPPPGPFAFADPAYVGSILAAAGWRAPTPERVGYSYVAGTGADPVADATALFSRIGPTAAVLAAATAAERPALVERLAAVCERYRDGDQVVIPAVAWIWSAERDGGAR